MHACVSASRYMRFHREGMLWPDHGPPYPSFLQVLAHGLLTGIHHEVLAHGLQTGIHHTHLLALALVRGTRLSLPLVRPASPPKTSPPTQTPPLQLPSPEPTPSSETPRACITRLFHLSPEILCLQSCPGQLVQAHSQNLGQKRFRE